MKKPRLKRDWEGRHVRLRRTLETKGGEIFEPGEIMLVRRNHGGLHLSAVRECAECRRRHRGYIHGVSEHDVTLLPEDYRPDELQSIRLHIILEEAIWMLGNTGAHCWIDWRERTRKLLSDWDHKENEDA